MTKLNEKAMTTAAKSFANLINNKHIEEKNQWEISLDTNLCRYIDSICSSGSIIGS